MATWSVTLPFRSSNQGITNVFWDQNFGQIPSALIQGGGTAYLRYIELNSSRSDWQIGIELSATTTEGPAQAGPSLSSDVLNNGFLLFSGNGQEYVVGGLSSDPNEPHNWAYSDIQNLINAVAAGGTLTISDQARQAGEGTLSLASAFSTTLDVDNNERKGAGTISLTTDWAQFTLQVVETWRFGEGQIDVNTGWEQFTLQIVDTSRFGEGEIEVESSFDVTLAVDNGNFATGRVSADSQFRVMLLVGVNQGAAEDRARLAARDVSGQAEIYALEITHPALTEVIRIVADNTNHTVEGNTFLACAFRATLPQEVEGEIRRASVQVDNVGRKIMRWVEQSSGAKNAQMRILSLIPPAGIDTESIVAFDVNMNVAVAEINNEYISMQLADEAIAGTPGILLRHDPQLSPGLF